jgi:hypothetical protein
MAFYISTLGRTTKNRVVSSCVELPKEPRQVKPLLLLRAVFPTEFC